jgi:hypothetical protein
MKVLLERDFTYRIGPDTEYRFRAGVVVDGAVAEAAVAEGAGTLPKKHTPAPKITKQPRPDHEG